MKMTADTSTRQGGSSMANDKKAAIRPSLSLKAVMTGATIFLMIVLLYSRVDHKDATPVDFDTEARANTTMPRGSCLTYPESTATGTFLEILPGYEPSVCLARCHALPHCAGFVYSHSPPFCSLKSHMSPPQYSANSSVHMRCDNLSNEASAMKVSSKDYFQQSVQRWTSLHQPPSDVMPKMGGEYGGPHQLCAYTEVQVEAFLQSKHECTRGSRRFYVDGRWMSMEEMKSLASKEGWEDEGTDPIMCIVACLHHQRPCLDRKCLFPFFIRRGDSDAQVAGQMLEQEVMDRLSVVRGLGSILDAGSNVGIGAAIFATMYPEATIVSIEPSSTTFAILHLNTARFSNVVRVHSGLWNRVTNLAIVQMGRFNGQLSGAWTIQVMEVDKVPSNASILDTLPAVSVPFLLEELRLSRFDLAKIDVEGSEREIFQDSIENNLTWLDESRMAVIEVHDDMRKGAEKVVKTAFVDRKERWHFLAQEGEELYYVTDGLDGIPVNASKI